MTGSREEPDLFGYVAEQAKLPPGPGDQLASLAKVHQILRQHFARLEPAFYALSQPGAMSV